MLKDKEKFFIISKESIIWNNFQNIQRTVNQSAKNINPFVFSLEAPQDRYIRHPQQKTQNSLIY